MGEIEKIVYDDRNRCGVELVVAGFESQSYVAASLLHSFYFHVHVLIGGEKERDHIADCEEERRGEEWSRGG
jgi:hypothetical protein